MRNLDHACIFHNCFHLDTIRSKMKIERLKAMLENLKDDEKQSRVRNQHLLQDFDKVNELSDDLDTKARKLKRVKVLYCILSY